MVRKPAGTLVRKPAGTLVRKPAGTLVRKPAGTHPVEYHAILRTESGMLWWKKDKTMTAVADYAGITWRNSETGAELPANICRWLHDIHWKFTRTLREEEEARR